MRGRGIGLATSISPSEKLEASGLLNESLESIQRELNGIYELFAAVVASGHHYASSMSYTLTAVSRIWELLAAAVDIASFLDEDDTVPSSAWESLEKLERSLRRALTVEGRDIRHAAFLMRVLGVATAEAERCSVLWGTWSHLVTAHHQ